MVPATKKIITTAYESLPGGYSRLKNIFKAGQNYKNYDVIVSGAKNKIVGNVPKELIDIIVKNHPERKAELIKSTQSAFAEAAENLKLFQILSIDTIKSIKGPEKSRLFIYTQLMGKSIESTSKEVISFLKDISKNLKLSLREVLPQDSRISINHLGSGVFGNVFHLQIADASGKKILHDRVLKVFKDNELAKETVKLSLLKSIECLAKLSDEEVIQVMKNSPLFTNKSDSNLFRVLKNMRSKTAADVSVNFDFAKYADIHGVCAEANSFIRLKNILGHDLSKTDVIKADMFDLKRGYSISQFSDSDLPQIKSNIDFKKLGLIAKDLKAANIVRGRLVDYGAITLVHEVFSDKNILKLYKQIINRANPEERAEIIMRFKKLAQNPKTPFRSKYQTAIDLYEKVFTNSEL